jgi:predicted flap endonuclease-1-like 5' DNA nuclease
LRKKGAYTAYEIDPQFLKKEERQSLELMRLKGLGYKNMSLVKNAGIRNIEDLSKIDEVALSTILKQKNMRKVRIYLNAAKNYRKNITLLY